MSAQTKQKPREQATEAPQEAEEPQVEETPVWRRSRWLQGVQDSGAGEVRPLKGHSW
jgi:hypothetical protein